MIERIILVHRDRHREVDGIRDHSERLAEALSRKDIEVEQRGPKGLRRLAQSDRHYAVVIQYSPFCFGPWGFAPWLPAALLALRLRRNRPTIAIMVHEPYVPMDSLRWVLMGIWQRFQLAALRLAADVVFTSIEAWAERFRAQRPRRPVHHLPVGSNLPDRRGARAEERGRMECDEGTLLVAAFGRDHPSWMGGYVVEAVNAIARTGRPLEALVVGAEAPPLSGVAPSIRVHAPGYLEADDLARKLAAADLFLAPLIDGISTRRSSMMAALQHGLPVVGTAGPLTDPILSDSNAPLALAQVGRPDQFADAALELANGAAAREAAGAAGRRLYDRRFDWPVVASSMLAALDTR
jgi:glycosyltransferase involved in cell wall biosynthesis